jgi:uracil-DNA glycosylase
MGMICLEQPDGLRAHAERAARRACLREPHIVQLTEYVDEIRRERSQPEGVPYFDPYDGGIEAAALFLLEAPGPRAVDTGFISRDNPDPTARRMGHLLAEAGLARAQTVLWNVVPWYLGTGRQIAPASEEDISLGLKWLARLLPVLHRRLRLVVLVGRPAQRARGVVEGAGLDAFDMWHPSSRVCNRWPEKAMQVRAVISRVARILTME